MIRTSISTRTDTSHLTPPLLTFTLFYQTIHFVRNTCFRLLPTENATYVDPYYVDETPCYVYPYYVDETLYTLHIDSYEHSNTTCKNVNDLANFYPHDHH
eukprot:5770244-Prymnesium_polylepis.1